MNPSMTSLNPTAHRPAPSWWPAGRALDLPNHQPGRLERIRAALDEERRDGLTAARCRE